MSDLTKQVAEIYNVPKERMTIDEHLCHRLLPLNQDIETLVKMAIKNEILMSPCSFYITAVGTDIEPAREFFAEHKNDKIQATCTAIMRALVAIKE